MAKLTKEEARIKAIPGKEMLAAIQSMNTYLGEKEGSTLVVFEKQPKSVALSNLLEPIVVAIEAGEGETLPDDVIAFYNDHLVIEEETPKDQKKEKKTKKEKKPKAPRKPSNEQATFDMVATGKADAEILKYFKGIYAGKDKDDKFIAKRAGIYTNIAKRKYAGENAEFAKSWAAEKEAAKPKKEKKAPVEKKAPADKAPVEKKKTAGAKVKVKTKAGKK